MVCGETRCGALVVYCTGPPARGRAEPCSADLGGPCVPGVVAGAPGTPEVQQSPGRGCKGPPPCWLTQLLHFDIK